MSGQVRAYLNVIDFSDLFSEKKQPPHTQTHHPSQEKGKWVECCLKLGLCCKPATSKVDTSFGMERNSRKIQLLFWIQKKF